MKGIRVAIYWLISLMPCWLMADTDVYVTNNSGQPAQIIIEQTGNDQLELGDEWIQHVNHLGPYETKMVLSFNRWQGVKTNKTYLFETRLSYPDGDSVTLNQELKGYWNKTTLRHGASSHDKSLKWHTDRNIHRFHTTMDGFETPVEVAFKAKATARYDDLYYAITPQHKEETPNNNGSELKVLTYNIWALPAISSHINDRFELIPDYVKGYDVLLIQEAFAAGRDEFLRELAQEYPYQTRMLDKPGINLYDGGVIIVSRFPIVSQDQYVFPDCSGTDCFADKGASYAEIIKHGKAYHLVATHAASSDSTQARENRQKQFRQMRELIQRQSIPKSEVVLYGGDFNVNKRKFPDDYQSMLANLASIEPDYAGYTESTFDPRINSFAGKTLSGGDNVEYLDYIVVSKEYAATAGNNNTVKVPRTGTESLWEHWDLSDHFPVKAAIY